MRDHDQIDDEAARAFGDAFAEAIATPGAPRHVIRVYYRDMVSITDRLHGESRVAVLNEATQRLHRLRQGRTSASSPRRRLALVRAR